MLCLKLHFLNRSQTFYTKYAIWLFSVCLHQTHSSVALKNIFLVCPLTLKKILSLEHHQLLIDSLPVIWPSSEGYAPLPEFFHFETFHFGDVLNRGCIIIFSTFYSFCSFHLLLSVLFRFSKHDIHTPCLYSSQPNQIFLVIRQIANRYELR